MRKEVIFALILGSLLGGVILYGIKLANHASNIPNNTPPTTQVTPTATPTPKTKNILTIITPENHTVSFETPIPLKGSSEPNSTIVIVSDGEEKIITSDASGNFDTTVNLIGGENNLLINAFNLDTLIASASVQVIYTTTTIE